MEERPTFTPEAERALAEESAGFADELRRQAIDEALRVRGLPLEVTASDVRRARRQFVRRSPQTSPRVAVLLQLYVIFGVILMVGGILYPFARTLMEKADEATRTSLGMAVVGAVMVVASLVARSYLRARLERSWAMFEEHLRDRVDQRRSDRPERPS